MEKKKVTKDIHKEKCKALKKIRKSIADSLNIDLHQTECTFQGKCSGTCPKCRQEEDILNKALLARTAAVAGAVVLTASLTACDGGKPVELEGEATLASTEICVDGELEDYNVDESSDESTDESSEESSGESADESSEEGSDESTDANVPESGSDEIVELEGDVVLEQD